MGFLWSRPILPERTSMTTTRFHAVCRSGEHDSSARLSTFVRFFLAEMGNYSSNEIKGAGKDVIEQTEESSHPLYQYLDLKSDGSLMKAFRKSQATKDYDEVDGIIRNELKRFLYNNGNGKMVAIDDLVQKRKESRQTSTKSRSSFLGKFSKPKKTFLANSEIELINKSFSLDSIDYDVANECAYRQVCWDIDSRGAVGESLLLLCFLNATKSNYDLAKRLLSIYPCMVNDIYLNDEYYGENCLHMAIVNENLEMVHFLCKNGINIHERAYGAFFCPEDQKDDREDNENLETINLNSETNYQSNTYWGEYPLSFAACLGQKDTVMYLLSRKACPNKRDTNGNTVLHMVVIHDRPDMYDLLLDYGCYCTCCSEIKVDVKNARGLTPLALAAKLANKEIFQHMVNRTSEVFWEYGGVSCAAFPLHDLDTTDKEGNVLETSALNIIVHEDSPMHLELLDGIIHNILNHKWKKGCRFRFFQLFFLYLIYLVIIGIALALRPPMQLPCEDQIQVSNASVADNVTTTKQCDSCYLRNAVYESPSQTARGVFEVLANLWAISFLIFIVVEMVSQGFRTVGLGLVYNPIRGLFALSCALVPVCLISRFLCLPTMEDYLTITSLMLAWPYALMFCKGFALTGPYVVMIYQMLKKDFIIFFIIYMVFVIGFSQAMFLVSLGYIDSSVKDHMFSRWFSSGLGLIIMSLGEFGDLNEQLMESNSPFKTIGLVMFFTFMILGALLIVNMLIAMMGNTYTAVESTEKEWTRQWGRIVLNIERMFSPRQKLKLQQSYSEPYGSNNGRALIMRLRNNNKG